MSKLTKIHGEYLEGGTITEIDEKYSKYTRLYTTGKDETVFIKTKAIKKIVTKKDAKKIKILEDNRPNTCGYDEYDYWIDTIISILDRLEIDVNYSGLYINIFDEIRDIAEDKLKK